jgi:hypothetical protein
MQEAHMIEAPAPDETATSSSRTFRWLILIVLGMVVLYAVLTWLFWLPSFIQTPRASIGTITKRQLDGTLLIAMNGFVLYALYAVGAVILWRASILAKHRLIVWVGAIGVCAILLWSYPVTSTDIFDYFFRSRMFLVYDANPYLNLPNQYKGDQFLRYIGWPNAPSAYGPLWEYLSALLVWAAGSSLLTSVLLYKLLSAVTHLVCGALIETLIEARSLKTLGAYLWLLNPLALWELVAVGHNDGLMVLALLLALLAVRSNLHWLAILALTGGALVKFLPAIFLPLVVLDWMRQQPTWRERSLRGLGAFLLVALPTMVLYAPYWDLPATWSQLGVADKLAAVWNGRNTTLRNLAAVGLGWQAWHVWFRRRPLAAAFLGLLLWYVLGSSQWFQPWYILWILAIATLRPMFSQWQWLTVWALMAQASYLLQYIVLPNWKLSGQTLEAQALYLVLIYVLPAVVWLVNWKRDRHKRPGHKRPQPQVAAVP